MMLDDVLGIPDQLRDALWRVESSRLEPTDAAGLMVCGMGGSAIGGDLAAAAIGNRCRKPLVTVRGYELPSWATEEWLVLGSSYSGETAETLACMASAEALGAQRIVATTGGKLAQRARETGVPIIGLPGVFQPRAAVAYLFVTAAEAAALAGATPSIRDEIEAAAGFVERLSDSLRELADELAAQLDKTIPVIHGSGLTAPLANRWKTQINESSKLPAFHSELPEAGHNELEGWAGAEGSRLSAIFLEDDSQQPRERRRMELTASLLKKQEITVSSVQTAGESRSERLLWGVMLGDLLSLSLARLAGTDPEPVHALDEVKGQLGDYPPGSAH